jgi:hypothetical protein
MRADMPSQQLPQLVAGVLTRTLLDVDNRRRHEPRQALDHLYLPPVVMNGVVVMGAQQAQVAQCGGAAPRPVDAMVGVAP